jgi:lipopolysaccharide transport system permease protein
MYVSAVVYPPIALVQKMPEYVWLVQYNPLYLYYRNHIQWMSILGWPTQLICRPLFFLLIGILIFNKFEEFIDAGLSD